MKKNMVTKADTCTGRGAGRLRRSEKERESDAGRHGNSICPEIHATDHFIQSPTSQKSDEREEILLSSKLRLMNVSSRKDEEPIRVRQGWQLQVYAAELLIIF